MSARNISHARRRLLRWYDKNRRDLPWRQTADPYAIWIAETMLQQTQVKTVLPYYERFMKTLPTVVALQRATLRKVLALWSGLGYYRRAESLMRAAREIARKHGGEIPASYDSLRSLPGIGDYTASALMSIAFGHPFPALDGNVRRVLHRFFGAATEIELRRAGRRFLSRAKPGDFNQALMELGATICISRNPSCLRCPIAPDCVGRASLLRPPPLRKRRIPVRDIDWPLALVCRDGKVLLRQRAAQGILPGLWELPGGERPRGESFIALLSRHLRELNGAVKPEYRIGAFRHSITNRRISSSVFVFSVVPGATLRLPNRQWRWFTPSALDRHPISAMTRKAISRLQAHDKSSS
ncbi:MAG: A/G-specific adenine glycosylase [Candidatus Binatia bacterium]